jgi:hypothetical protein
MSTNVADLGIYIWGDTGTGTLIPVVDEDGDVMDLTLASGITLECVSPQRDVISVAASVLGDAKLGRVVIEDLASAFLPTTSRPLVHFEGVVRWTQGGEPHYSRDRVKFAIELFP